MQTWVGEKIVEVIGGSKTWAALGEAITGAFAGGLDFLLAGKNAAADFVSGLLDFFTSNSPTDLGLDLASWLRGQRACSRLSAHPVSWVVRLVRFPDSLPAVSCRPRRAAASCVLGRVGETRRSCRWGVGAALAGTPTYISFNADAG